ncbi:flagellar hook-length control protein FliK [Tateyamaria sp. SN6-1]|uniref:flagellar hook-length control protein FliK n=1 Tax=Tateyamaria sp. SN6-1 TaxID=3092148 RepID=UPI0039F4A5FB
MQVALTTNAKGTADPAKADINADLIAEDAQGEHPDFAALFVADDPPRAVGPDAHGLSKVRDGKTTTETVVPTDTRNDAKAEKLTAPDAPDVTGEASVVQDGAQLRTTTGNVDPIVNQQAHIAPQVPAKMVENDVVRPAIHSGQTAPPPAMPPQTVPQSAPTPPQTHGVVTPQKSEAVAETVSKPSPSPAETPVVKGNPPNVLETILSAAVQTDARKTMRVDITPENRTGQPKPLTQSEQTTHTLKPNIPTGQTGKTAASEPKIFASDERTQQTEARVAAKPEITAATFQATKTQTASVQPAPNLAVAPITSVSAEPVMVLQGEPGDVVTWDLRTAPTTTTASPSMVPQRTDMPPAVAQQIAIALHKGGDKPLEIALNPPELGRVRMVMTASETGVVVTVLAERSDTLDMMRRNIDDLARSLSDLGYDDISFAFGQGDTGAEQHNEDQLHDGLHLEHAEGDIPPTGPDPTSLSHLALAPDSIDIRL